MVVLSYTIVSDLENHGIQFSANPSHGTVLFRDLAALVNAVRLTKQFRSLFKSNTAFSIRPQLATFCFIEVRPQTSITVIPHRIHHFLSRDPIFVIC